MESTVPPNSHPTPPLNFDELDLPISIHEKKDYYRLNNAKNKNAIYFDKSGSGRFDGKHQAYGICYVGESLEASFIECFGRELGVRFLSQNFLSTRNLFLINSNKKLKLVNLFGSGLAKLGMDSRITSGEDYNLARLWCNVIYQHPEKVDGIRYYSRHDNTRLCCGLFDRTHKTLIEKNLGNLIEQHPQELASLLNLYDFGIG